MSEKIQPRACPFCGSNDLRLDNGGRDGVSCRGCGVWMPGIVSSEPGESHTGLAAWNRRSDPRIQKAREALVKAKEAAHNGWKRALEPMIDEALAELEVE